MRKLNAIFLGACSLMLVSASVNAANAVKAPGVSHDAAENFKQSFYLGGHLGGSRIDEGNYFENITKATGASNQEIDQGGFGWNVYAGVNLNKYFALEAGYNQYADNTYDASTDSAYLDEKVSASAFDLMAKATLPISNTNWFVFAKGGFSSVTTKLKVTSSVHDFDGSATAKGSAPKAAVGFGYKWNQVAVDVTASKVFGENLKASSKDDYVPSLGFVGAGLSYTFKVS